jgi:hypothetical protein
MVGHTHEDIDQMFSRIAFRLANLSVFSMEKMAFEIAQSFRAEGIPINVIIGIENVSQPFSCYRLN